MGEVIVDNVSKSFSLGRGHDVKQVDALINVSFGAHDNEIVVIVGPSGCGKSTILRIIMGLETLSSGLVTVDGRRVSGCGHDRCYVFQQAQLLPWLSALRNVMFGLEMKGVREPELTQIAADHLELVGLGKYARMRPYQMSGGMQQRVGIARALAPDPSVLLMDEPFGALDAQTRETLQKSLVDIQNRTKKTILFVTHDLDEAVVLADRVVIMRSGRVHEEIDVGVRRKFDDFDAMRKSAEFARVRDYLAHAIHGDNESHVEGRSALGDEPN